MKLEEVNTRTKEAVDFLVAALESGHSEVLTAYLGAMAKFHTYSFGNIMLIARQKPVTFAGRPEALTFLKESQAEGYRFSGAELVDPEQKLVKNRYFVIGGDGQQRRL